MPAVKVTKSNGIRWTKAKRLEHGRKIQATRRRNAKAGDTAPAARVRTNLQKLVRDAVNDELKRIGLL